MSPYKRLNYPTADASKSLNTGPEVRVAGIFGKAEGIDVKSFQPDAGGAKGIACGFGLGESLDLGASPAGRLQRGDGLRRDGRPNCHALPPPPHPAPRRHVAPSRRRPGHHALKEEQLIL